MKTIIYIDGLNLFHGILQNSPYYWLDVAKMCQKLIPNHHKIIKIKYFTTRLEGYKGNPKIAIAHNTHLNALVKSTSDFEYIAGYFRKNISKNITKMELHEPFRIEHNISPKLVEVIRKKEEKGTDVNLASHFLNDAWLDNYECAVLVSNDGDLFAPLVLVKKHHTNKKVGLISPVKQSENIVKKLKLQADFKRIIKDKHLKSCQLPNNIPNSKIKKPFASW